MTWLKDAFPFNNARFALEVPSALNETSKAQISEKRVEP